MSFIIENEAPFLIPRAIYSDVFNLLTALSFPALSLAILDVIRESSPVNFLFACANIG